MKGAIFLNIFIREMRSYRKSLILWCIGVILMVISGMSKYGGLSTSGQSMNEVISKMPKSLQAIMGTNSLDLSKATGYYGLLFLYLVIMATIHASMLGASIISKEESDRTAEFLMAKPVSRNNIITSKLLASLVNIIIFNTTTYVSSIIMVKYYAKGESITRDVTLLMIGLFILQLIFLFIGTGIAAISKNPKTATSISTTILLATFILSVIINMNDRLQNLKYLTPFKYYEAKNLFNSGLDSIFVFLSFLIISGLLIVTYTFYGQRDLNV